MACELLAKPLRGLALPALLACFLSFSVMALGPPIVHRKGGYGLDHTLPRARLLSPFPSLEGHLTFGSVRDGGHTSP